MVHLERKGWLWRGGGFLQIKIFNFFVDKKNTGKMARAQGKHREFGINWSVAYPVIASQLLSAPSLESGVNYVVTTVSVR